MSVPETTDCRLRCVLPFEALPGEVTLLRRAAAKQLSRWGMPVAVDEAEVIVTELATNVVKHVGEGTSATLVLEWRRDRLRLEVHDRSPALPSPRGADCYEECGRGLHLIAGLAIDWGAVLTAAGKAVWCEVPLTVEAGCRRIERAAEVLERYQCDESGASRHGRSRDAGLDESAVELIADLLHWTAVRGHDPDDILDRALMHYEAEAEAA
ncbi:ATP-binding protein [Streptomyces sp. NBC_00557]|uniref:ATP-binding protein n=1 Tax=Streptomyces sp. NBC_00557 TaxID=2975776 RepID=UPI002E80AC45|nr:ATP-binding protein [Streptomyces sp. NBC_00557]WUC36733.1 ATP-binding protein [Streptomyces sp. NBC_00557]